MKKIGLLFMAGLFPAILAGAWVYFPFCETGPLMCLWQRIFGVECYGCGIIRAISFLIHGRVGEAIAFNWLVIPVVCAMAMLSGQALCELLRGSRTSLGVEH